MYLHSHIQNYPSINPLKSFVELFLTPTGVKRAELFLTFDITKKYMFCCGTVAFKLVFLNAVIFILFRLNYEL